MDLETYKQKVRECLIKEQNCTEQYAEKLMKLYEDDFQEALYDYTWTPQTMASAMTMGY